MVQVRGLCFLGQTKYGGDLWPVLFTVTTQNAWLLGSPPPHTGDIGWNEFLQIMTSTLQKLHEQPDGAEERGHQLPFTLMATQYRRMKYLSGIISGDKDSLRELVRLAEQQQQTHLSAQRVQEVMGTAEEPAAASSHELGGEPESIRPSPGSGSSQQRRLKPREALQRLARTHTNGSLVQGLPPDQLRLIQKVASHQERLQQQRQQQQQQISSPAYSGGGGASPRQASARRPMGEILSGSVGLGGAGPLSRSLAPVPPRASASLANSPRGTLGRESAQSPRLSSWLPESPASPSPRSSVAHQNLLEMPHADLQLVFTRPTLKIPGCSTPRVGHQPHQPPHPLQAGWGELPLLPTSPRRSHFVAQDSPRLRTSADRVQAGIQTAVDVAAVLREHTPLSTRQRALDYAAALSPNFRPTSSEQRAGSARGSTQSSHLAWQRHLAGQQPQQQAAVPSFNGALGGGGMLAGGSGGGGGRPSQVPMLPLARIA